MNKRYILYCALVLVALTATWVFAAGHSVEEKSVLSGTVITDSLAVTGQVVKEGDILVCVDTITGPAVASRATTDGIVSAVLIKAGDQIKQGDIVVKIESRK
jgi:biotin carboxyl carrier protein